MAITMIGEFVLTRCSTSSLHGQHPTSQHGQPNQVLKGKSGCVLGRIVLFGRLEAHVDERADAQHVGTDQVVSLYCRGLVLAVTVAMQGSQQILRLWEQVALEYACTFLALLGRALA
jgi:hypothetical protein